MIPIKTARIAFVPISPDLTHPADRRRFCYLAESINLEYEVYKQGSDYDLIILTETSDISYWRRLNKDSKIIFNLTNSHLAEGLNLKSMFRGIAKYISRQHKYLDINYIDALKKMCQRADAVICATKEQKDYISKYCKNTHILFDAHFSEVKRIKEDFKAHSPFRLVWEGLPSNTYQLKELTNLLANSNIKEKVELNVITDRYGYMLLNKYIKRNTEKYLRKLSIKTNFFEWSRENLENVCLNSDLAIIPIDLKDPMMLGKPENKLILLWRMGLPAIVGGTPSYIKIMKEVNQNNYITKKSDWIPKLNELIDSKSKREIAGMEGFNYVCKNYNKEKFIKKWENLFNSIGFSI